MKKLELIGKKFGKLLVLSEVEKLRPKKWNCLCDCGEKVTVVGYDLSSGNTKSCGCSRHDTQLTNFEGKKIGHYTVLKFDKMIKVDKKIRNYWICQCECGTIKSVSHSTLRKRNGVQNCGCITRANLVERSTKPNAGFNKVYRGYKNRASLYAIPFNLEVDTFYNLTQLHCHYCGAEPYRKSSSWSKNIPPFIYNGIDRIDSNCGYEDNNCVPCCTRCNYDKNSMTLNEFKLWIKQVYNHMFK